MIALYVAALVICVVFMAACGVGKELIGAVSVVMSVAALFGLVYDYCRKNAYYQRLFQNLDRLDQKYLILETMKQPEFYEGELFAQVLYEANKSMTEQVNENRRQMKDFKDFIEMWVHQVKLPVASLLLLCHNHPENLDKKFVEQLRRINRYTEQVLYYTRAEHSEKDYLFQRCSLAQIVHKAAMKNKDDLLENKVEFQVSGCDHTVVTDMKWMEFILDQIINNSIKYRRETDAMIQISTSAENGKTILSIKDNGIGIAESDLPRLFEKSFTGGNGRLLDRMEAKSTEWGFILPKTCATSWGMRSMLFLRKVRIHRSTLHFCNIQSDWANDKWEIPRYNVENVIKKGESTCRIHYM